MMNSVNSTDLLSTVVQHYPDGILVLNGSKEVLLMNTAGRRLFEAAGMNLREGDVFPFPVSTEAATELALHRSNDGSPLHLGLSANEGSLHDETLVMVAVTDVTEKIALQEQLKGDALRDELTQLFNRKGFTSLAEHQILLAQREKTSLSVIFLDLDGLKEINDTFGHAEGDRAICDFAMILNDCVRKSDIVARLGGDEFAIIVLGHHALASESVLIRLTTRLHRFNASQGRPYNLDVSFGSAHLSYMAPCTLAQLLERADESMYTNKRAKKLTRWAASCANLNKIKYAS